MMHGHEKSDPDIVAIRTNAGRMRREKPANKAGNRGGAGGAKGRDQGERGPAKHAPGAGPGKRVPGAGSHTASRKAQGRRNGSPRFSITSTPRCCVWRLTPSKGTRRPGADGLTWRDYEADLERRLEELHDRVQRGAYRPQPSRRAYIPKADGRQRPLAVAAVEDKIVQGAVGDGAERDLRGRFPRVLVRVPAGTWTSTMRWMLWWSGSTAAR